MLMNEGAKQLFTPFYTTQKRAQTKSSESWARGEIQELEVGGGRNAPSCLKIHDLRREIEIKACGSDTVRNFHPRSLLS